MFKYQVSQPVDVEVDVLRDATNSQKFREFLAREHSSLARCEMQEEKREGDTLLTVVRFGVKHPLPSVLKKLISEDKFAITERTELNLKDNSYEFSMASAYFQQSGRGRFLANGPGRSKREIEGELKVLLPVVGSIFDGYSKKETLKGLAEEAEIIARFLKSQG